MPPMLSQRQRQLQPGGTEDAGSEVSAIALPIA